MSWQSLGIRPLSFVTKQVPGSENRISVEWHSTALFDLIIATDDRLSYMLTAGYPIKKRHYTAVVTSKDHLIVAGGGIYLRRYMYCGSDGH